MDRYAFQIYVQTSHPNGLIIKIASARVLLTLDQFIPFAVS